MYPDTKEVKTGRKKRARISSEEITNPPGLKKKQVKVRFNRKIIRGNKTNKNRYGHQWI